MARKTRKTNLAEVPAPSAKKNSIYHAALYVRISIENEEKRNADSIGTQIQMLKDFVSECDDIMIYDVYCDDDFSGTDFVRPEFSRMMNDIRDRKVNCVVVKDLSRLGRNLIETGEYIEKVFPFFGVRFIAINDHCDTKDTQIDLSIQIKNWANEMYAKDISRKICSTKKSQQIKGQYTGGNPVYGYILSPDDKHQLIPDPETAPVIKRIYEMFLAGNTVHGITMQLNREGLPSPGRLKYIRGLVHADKFKNALWSFTNVRGILNNEIYLGWMVSGKVRSEYHCGGQKAQKMPPEQWVVVKGTHEPIITEDQFQAAQAQFAGYKEKHALVGRYDCKSNKGSVLRGKLKCGECGKAMFLRRKKNGAGVYQEWYCCPIHDHYDSSYCPNKAMKREKLDSIILRLLQSQIQLYKDACQIISAMNKKKESCTKFQIYQDQVRSIRSQIERYTHLKASLYQDYSDGVITEQDYLEMNQQYAQKADELTIFLSELEREKEKYSPDFVGAIKWQKAIEEFSECNSLSRPLVEALIDKVTVYSDGHVEVKFNFRDEVEQVLLLAASRDREVNRYAV